MHRSIRSENRTIARTQPPKQRDYLKSMRLWTNFFAVSGVELVFMERHHPLQGADILEVGCGNGRLSLKLAESANSVAGIDLDTRLVDFATEYAATAHLPNLRFLEMRSEALAFKDESFDIVVMPWMLHMVQERQQALLEARRVLKPGGKLMVFALYGDCDYDRIARQFIGTRDREMDPRALYEEPLESTFGAFAKELLPSNSSDFSFVFPDCGVTAEAFTFAFENWYDRKLKDIEKGRLRHIIQNYKLGNHIELKTRGAFYVATKSDDQISRARNETLNYHRKYYSNHDLFDQDSWLAKPDPTLMELSEKLINEYAQNPTTKPLQIIDLGTGVGRNCVPLAQKLKEKNVPAQIECLDILPESIQLLQKYAGQYGVEEYIQARVEDNDNLALKPGSYNLVIAISTLEHCRGKEKVREVLQKLARAVTEGGYCQIEMTTDRNVKDLSSGAPVPTFVETPLTKEEVSELLQEAFDASFERIKEVVFPYKEELEMDGRKVLWQSCQTSFVVRRRHIM